MAADKKTSRLQITIAIIGVVGVIGAALITNWDKIFSQQDEVIPANQITVEEACREAEQITARYFDAFISGDIDVLMELSKIPFYYDNEVILSMSDLRVRYQNTSQEIDENQITIDGIMSGTIADYKQKGFDLGGDRLLSSIKLTDKDIIVALTVSTESLSGEGIGFYFRLLKDKVELAGFWD